MALKSFNVFDEIDFSHSFDGMVIDGDRVIDEEVNAGDLQVTGNAKFMEEVDTDSVEIIGTAEFRTFATCDDLNVSGSAVFKDEVVAESIVISGGATINGKVNADVLIVEGKLKVNSKVNVLSIGISGYMNCIHRVYFDKCHVKGSLVVSDLVKGIDIKFKSSAKSSLKRLVADNITVAGKPSEAAYILTCDEADCGIADMEYAKIDHLMCDEAKIGRGCRIGLLEYRERAAISKDAFVEKIVKI
ncbi:MAG: hypothetical protein IJZ90_03165 [Clostridia bacterium]|nr:hypothetical protein [Clostridia bacterium]